MKYCTLFPRYGGKYTVYTAPRYYFIETRADMEAVRKEVGFDILRERMLQFQATSQKSADPARQDDEESEGLPEQPDAAMEGSSGASEIPREPDRLLVTSGAESSEWIAAGGKQDAPEVQDVSEVRLPDTTSGSEVQQEDDFGTPNMYQVILKELHYERRPEVRLYAEFHGIDDALAPQHVLETALEAVHGGAVWATEYWHAVRTMVDVELESPKRRRRERVGHEPDPPRTEEESSQGSRLGSQSDTPAPSATEGELRTIFGTPVAAEALEKYHDDSLLTTVTSRAPFRVGQSASTAYAEGRSVRSPSTPARAPPADSEPPAVGTVQYCDDVTAPAERKSSL